MKPSKSYQEEDSEFVRKSKSNNRSKEQKVSNKGRKETRNSVKQQLKNFYY